MEACRALGIVIAISPGELANAIIQTMAAPRGCALGRAGEPCYLWEALPYHAFLKTEASSGRQATTPTRGGICLVKVINGVALVHLVLDLLKPAHTGVQVSLAIVVADPDGLAITIGHLLDEVLLIVAISPGDAHPFPPLTGARTPEP
jgi:hypothetical protein